MRRMGAVSIGLAMLFFQVISACAEDTIDALEKDLQDIKENHQEAASQAIGNFLTQLETASESPDAALDLYKKSGGPLPPGAPVQSAYDHETPSEKAARESQDNAKLSNLAYVAQLHCGLMRFAALFITTPDQKGLQDDWIAWLKNAPQIYLQIKDDGLPEVRELKNKPVRDSIISSALNFGSWGDKEQGHWSVIGLAELYRTDVLEPLRATPTADTLAAWDVYISLKSANQPNQDRWTQVEQPSLMFDRGCDDYTMAPSMDKLQTLVEIIKANPAHPRLDEMIGRVHTLVQDYRTRHGGGTAAPAPVATAPADSTPPANPNVKVTTVTDGDMTIITTQSNGTSTTPPPAPAPAVPPAAN